MSTCNRVEITLRTKQKVNEVFFKQVLEKLYPNWSVDELDWGTSKAEIYRGQQAVYHLYRVAASLESLVIGEREVLMQVKNAYERCKKLGLTGDFLRLLMQKTVETAKQIYTKTEIAKHPVSIVTLAYRKLKALQIHADARVIFVGSGRTNTLMAKYLKKHGYTNFVVFNRTLANARVLASELEGNALPLDKLRNYGGGFDVLITCTGSDSYIITHDLYRNLLQGERDRKTVIDLSIPHDLEARVLDNFDVHYIDVNGLQEIAGKNAELRKDQLVKCEKIIKGNLADFNSKYKERHIELAMRRVPKTVKEIKRKALQEVFARDLAELDHKSREVLDKVIGYMEKKYMSAPMVMAKEILLRESF